MQELFGKAPKINVRPILAAVIYGIALFVGLGIPLGHLAVRFTGEADYLRHVAEGSADHVSLMVYENPGMWRYLQERYFEVMERNQDRDDRITQTFVTEEGETLLRIGPELRGPLIERTGTVTDGVAVVGRIVVRGELGPIIRETAVVGLFTLLVAGIMVVVLREIPLKVLAGAVEDLSRSRETLRRIFGGLPDAVFLVTPASGRVLDYNVAALTLTGLPASALRGTMMYDFFADEAATNAVREGLGKARGTSGKQQVGEFRLRGVGGEGALVAVTVIDLSMSGDEDIAVVILQNVTEREMHLAALRESEERYRSFVESFQGIAFRGRMDFVPVFFHGAVRELTGYEEWEFLAGTPSWDAVVHPDDLQRFLDDGMALVSIPGTSIERDYRIIRKDGQERFVREIVHNVTDGSGTPRFVEGVILDITERRRQQDQLRLSEERFRLIGESAQDAIVVADDEAVIRFWNPAAEKIFGYGEAEAVGMSLRAIIASERGTDDLAGSLRSHHERAGATDVETVRVFEMAGLRKGGGRFPLELSLAGVRTEGRWNSIMVIRDVSEREEELRLLRESEERFRRVFEESEDAVVLLDAETLGVIEGNRQASELFGCSSHELKRNGLEVFLGEEGFERLSDGIRSENQQQGFRLEKHLGIGPSRETILAVTGRSIVMHGKRVMYCLFRDITENVRLNENWRLSLERLVQAEKMAFLGMMVSGFAHDVNNPNQLIMVNLGLVQDAWDDASEILERSGLMSPEATLGGLPFGRARELVPEAIRDMASGAKRIADIVNNLLAFVKEDRPEHEEDVDINAAVEDAVALIRHKIRKSTDHFRLATGEDLPLCRGNRSQVERVVVNLILNALEALPDRARGVEVSTEYDNESGRILVHVLDEGHGIPPEIREKVKEPFFTTKHGSGGTGLGLAITEILVREHGGDLTIESRDGGGTTVTASFACIH